MAELPTINQTGTALDGARKLSEKAPSSIADARSEVATPPGTSGTANWPSSPSESAAAAERPSDNPLIEATPAQAGSEYERAARHSSETELCPEIPGYQIQRSLGKGTFGRVWLAVEEGTGIKVAVKEFTISRQNVREVQSEIKQLAMLASNPGIVRLIDTELDADPPYFIMDYCEGGPLAGLIEKNGGPLPVPRALEILTQVTQTMAYVHACGIIHCDLKLGNVLLDQPDRPDRPGHPRVIDFGQAHLSRAAGHGALGTFFYMPPDQATTTGTLCDTRWDVYALGAIFYALVTGAPPHQNVEFVRSMHRTKDLPEKLRRYRDHLTRCGPPRAHRDLPGMDAKLAEIIERCLEMSPSDRWHSAGHLLGQLQKRQEKVRLRESYFLPSPSRLPPDFTLLPAGPLPVARAVEVFTRVVRQLTFPHEKGIVHGRLTSDVVFANENGAIAIGDWTPGDLTMEESSGQRSWGSSWGSRHGSDTDWAKTKSESSGEPIDLSVTQPDIQVFANASAQELPPVKASVGLKAFRRGLVSILMAVPLWVFRTISQLAFRVMPRREVRLPTPSVRSVRETSVHADIASLGHLLRSLLMGPAPADGIAGTSVGSPSAGPVKLYCARFWKWDVASFLVVPFGDRKKIRVLDGFLFNILERCLRPNDGQEYENAGEVARALQFREIRVRNRDSLGRLLALSLALFVAVGFGMWWYIRDSSRGPRESLMNAAKVSLDQYAKVVARSIGNSLEETGGFLRKKASDQRLVEQVRNTSALLDTYPNRSHYDESLAKQAKSLGDLLAEFLNATEPDGEKTNRAAHLIGTLVVLDRRGFILYRYPPRYDHDDKNEILGQILEDHVLFDQDYSWREYFHGRNGEQMPGNFSGRRSVPGENQNPPMTRPHVCRPFRSTVKGEGITLCLSTPILGDQGVEGVLLATWDTRKLREKMNEITAADKSVSETVRVAVFSPVIRSRVFFHSQDLPDAKKAEGSEADEMSPEASFASKLESKFVPSSQVDRNAQVRPVDQDSGWFEFEAVKDAPGRCLDPLDNATKCIFAEAPVRFGRDETPWQVVAMGPEEVILEPIDKFASDLRRGFTVLMIALALVVAGALAAFVWRVRREERTIYA